MKTYFVYMLLCADGSYYIGVTNDLERRLWEHQHGLDPDSYTHERRPVTLAYSADFRDIDQAIAWEKHIKGWSRAKKRALAENNWPLIHTIVRDERRKRNRRRKLSR
jgi:putative endonuclease